MEWFLKSLRQYADFDSRARRKEYWMFRLFEFIFSIVCISIDYLIMKSVGFWIPIITIVFLLGILIPSIAVTVRRLHDVDKSGWMMFISLIPLVGGIWLLVLLCTDSTYGENEYGPNPKGIGNEDDAINTLMME